MATCCLLHLKEIGTCEVPFAGGHVVLDELIVVQMREYRFALE